MIRPLLAVAALLLNGVAASATPVPQAVAADTPTIRLVEFGGGINIINQLRVTRAIADAEEAGDAMVLIELDTPGGQVVAVEQIVKAMLNSTVPTVVWVGPSGAHAASGGFFVLLAADYGAMAPATRTGAASTVMMGGENREDDVLLKKSNEDLAALIRSIAERRGGDVEAAEQAIFDARAYSESEALELGLVDGIFPTREALLEALDGETIELFDGTEVVLRTADASFVTTEFDGKQRLLEFLANPLVAFLLLAGAAMGIYVEVTNPGGIYPGVIGAVCLIFFLVSTTVLPITLIGVLLVVLGLAMFLLEIKVASFGLLTLGGTAALAAGAWLLVDGDVPATRVPPVAIVPTVLVMATLSTLIVRNVIRAHRAKIDTGVEGLVGELCVVRRALDPRGKVFVHGELWNAVATEGVLPVGTRARVVRVEDMWLEVAPLDGVATH